MMIVKFSVAFGVALTAIAWLLVVPYSPEATQMSMGSSVNSYREMGLLPASGTTTLSNEIGHGIFEVPASDAQQINETMASMGMDMDMGSSNGMTMDSMEKDEHGEEEGKEEAEGHADDKMDMAADSSMTMSAEDHANMAEMEDVDHGEEAEAGHDGGAGLKIVRASDVEVDKTIEIGMDDWGYNIEHAMVTKGETVRLVVTNNGNTPHEFMLMSMDGMKAVNYRIQRADWNLLEHEALFEIPIMMPGDTVEAVVEIEDSGMWMFMCMFPYHMEMGMMGMMMTPDRMGMMSGM